VIKISSFEGHKILKGFNTDIFGFRESLHPFLNNDIRAALVLGTGGSSRAIDLVLGNLGIEVTHAARKPQPGCLGYSQISEKVLAHTQLIVNTTPLGMYPETETFPDIKYQYLTEKHILYDLVYNPADTLFLQKGKERGCKVIGGLNMLHLQAEKSWSIWNDNTL
jgi:shikimate dehydrogenase